ncbi:hypothetical protein ACTJLC_09815 [Paraburkholderia sp. 22099]|mgnify:CR=1 FL=1|jgi:hypothetical protein|uniref:Uncharacterized protein n=1 Tax=Paraburkholderia terricola TaxID=169427 RepID=A0A1M6VJF1_9BURK|nr:MULTISPECIES: hypothetical protein [Paraburkholderia]MDR6410293.1 hypothetical protein [Paraburkholderia terricola]MDR6444167.1 hypothetical protein [Paraburkholderia terricola]MDR6481453.1 hypothetical protein [Paraburkholderia terricola]MDR6491761.1 hypothetical protein [Paraburkholderia terricola]SDP05484.1 hypothetical protein SAMN05192547_103910 [Paraburkholderia sediminicola]
MTQVSHNHSTTSSPSTHKTDDKDTKSKDKKDDQGGSQSDLDAAIQAFGSQVMMQIFQDQQERRAEDREEDEDAA